MIETITLGEIVKAIEVIGGLAAAAGVLVVCVRFIDKIKLTDETMKKAQEAHTKEFKAYQDTVKAELQSIRDEQVVVCYGLLACLKGLKEQGCNGPVTDALNGLEKHLNKLAHGED